MHEITYPYFIDDLPKTDEKTINKYQRFISKQIKEYSKKVGFQKARQDANKKYGKFWRERLEAKKIYNIKINN